MGGGKLAPQKKLVMLALFLHSREQNAYQGTQTQELTPKGSMTSLDPLLDRAAGQDFSGQGGKNLGRKP